MKKSVRYLLYGLILVVGLIGTYFAKGYFTKQNALIEAQAIETGYLYWHLNVYKPSDVETEMVQFIDFLEQRKEVDVTKINFSYLNDQVYLFYYTSNEFYVSCWFGVTNDHLDGQFEVLDANPDYQKLASTYQIDLTNLDHLYYQLDQFQLPIRTKYTITYLDQAGKTIKTYQVTHGRCNNQYPVFDSISQGIEVIEGIPYVSTYQFFDQDHNLYQFNQKIYQDVEILVEEQKETGVAYNGNRVFDNLEDALELSSPGSKIILLQDYQATNLVIPEGITLFIPCSFTNLNFMINGSTSHPGRYITDPAFMTLTVDQLTVNGKLIIASVIGRLQSSGQYQGHTSGNYGQLTVNDQLIVNGYIETAGYIRGTGVMKVYGSVYAPFVVKDYRGGSHAAGCYLLGKISPFSVYEMPNIQLESYYYDTAILGCYARLVASSAYHMTDSVIFGETGIVVLNPGGYIKSIYDPETEITKITINGGARDGSFVMDVVGYTISISEVLFPIHFGFEITFENGTYEINSAYKILTGSKITIASDAIVNLNNELIVYQNFTDTSFGGFKYPDLPAAQLNLYGTLNIKHTFGGVINAFEGSVISVSAAAILSIKSIEGYGENFGSSFTTTSTVIEIGQIKYQDQVIAITAGQEYRFEPEE